MYSLKVDWTRKRIAAVMVAVLEFGSTSVGNRLLRKLSSGPDDLSGYLNGRHAQEMEEEITLKLDLTPEQLDDLETVLQKQGKALAAELQEVTRALEEVVLYRFSVGLAQGG